MVKLVEKPYCTGCAACKAVCPRHAITMRQDAEGFIYPYIDASKCIGCGICKQACPSLNQGVARSPLGVCAAMAKDDTLRLSSSSGGVFSLLAKDVLAKGGVVFGAAFDHDDWHVYHRFVDNEADLQELRGSKYVQSDAGDCYNQVKDLLKAGRPVMFTGTPCQIAGLVKVLEANPTTPTEKLLLVDVVCHAVPSPLAWEKYLEKRLASVYNDGKGGLRDIRRISYRRKDCGWKRYAMSLTFANDMAYLACFNQDPFMRGFLSELYNRPSCHNCPCKNLKSGSDLTIADYWGVASKLPEMDDDKGTSLVLVNTEKGASAFASVGDMMRLKSSDFNHAVVGNSAIVRPTTPHRNRNRFFHRVTKSDFDSLVNRMLQPSLKSRIRALVGRLLRKFGWLRHH